MGRIRSFLVVVLACAFGCAGETPRDEAEVAVTVRMVALDEARTPVVILEETDGPRVLPIWIGSAEATSIAAEINRQPSPRPNSHDMAKRLVEGLEAQVESVVVTELRRNTYYALLTLRANGRRIEIDVRPSDGIALALRTEAPIRVRESVFAEAGEPIVDEGEGPAIGIRRDGIDPATPAVEL